MLGAPLLIDSLTLDIQEYVGVVWVEEMDSRGV
jgi:hypothetical protein